MNEKTPAKRATKKTVAKAPAKKTGPKPKEKAAPVPFAKAMAEFDARRQQVEEAESDEELLVAYTRLIDAMSALTVSSSIERQGAIGRLREQGMKWVEMESIPDLNLSHPRLIQLLQGRSGDYGRPTREERSKD